MDKIKATDLPYKYENELHCNEVMLLPYYIASMNIEHAYFERTASTARFQGFVWWIRSNLRRPKQIVRFMTEKTRNGLKRQKEHRSS